MAQFKTITLRDGATVSALGLGTWHMGEVRSARAGEVAALRTGIELGLTAIDTAEMYGTGGAEDVVAEAIAGQREKVFLVSKVMPQNASRGGTVAACEASLRRLKIDYIDLYLLHWRGSYSLNETVSAFERLREEGKVRAWGVSNFDVSDMAELAQLPAGMNCVANQVLYHLGSRGIEWQLLPEAQKSGLMVQAYCPLGQGRLIRNPTIGALARKHDAAPSAIALAWLLSKPGVQAIPKSSRPERVREFARAFEVTLDAEDFATLDRAFPPPRRKMPLDMT